MDEGEGGNSKHARDVRDSWYDDNTASATGGTSHHMRNAEEQAAKETAPGNGFGSFGEKNGDTGEGSSAANADARENGVQSDSAINRARDFINSVSGGKNLTGKDKGKKKGFFKVGGPIMAIMMTLGGYGGASFFGQMAMPISLISQFQGNFDSIGTSSFTRNQRITKWMMHPDTREVSSEANKFVKQHSKIYQFFTGDSGEKYFKITDRQKTKLSKHNIEVVDDDSVGQIMRYTAPDGRVTDVVADPSKATGGRVLIDDFYDNDVNFRSEYHKGTRTWRQAVVDWFDNLSKGFMEKIDVMRNRFVKFFSGADQETTKQEYEGTVKKAVGGDDYEGNIGKMGIQSEEGEYEGEDGQKHTYEYENRTDDNSSELNLKRGMKASEVADSLSKFSDGVGGKISKIAKQVTNGICTVSEIIGAINLLVMANEAMQILQVASTIFEGIQKTQVADSKESPMHDISNSLTKRKKVTYKTADGGTAETNGSAMSANAVSALYGNNATNPKDPSVNSFNLTDSLNNVMNAFGNSMTAYKGCMIAKLAGGIIEAGLDAVDVTTDIASIVACIGGAAFTAGASCAGVIAKIAIKAVAAATFSVLISTLIGHIISYIVPKVATMLARDLATDIGGEDFGNALVSGANMYMGQNHQFGGGSVASKDTLITYLQQRDAYIADKARLERETRSPFDISSPYTFMGSLMSRSIPILTQTSSIMSGISNVAQVAGDALLSLVPGASAMTAGKTAEIAAENTAATCPELDSIGAVGDAFCNPYFITDFGTMDIDPAEVTYKVSQFSDGKNFKLTDNEDNPKINTDPKESRLMRYILYCGQRSSGFGMSDQNIANAINSGAGKIESNIPIWGGIADVLQQGDLIQNVGYISGEACVTRNSGTDLGSDVFKWGEAAYYQRYIEDQRIAESVDLIDKSAVAVALEEYYAEHPIDASYEGIIAMKTGMTKEKVKDTIAIVEGVMWLANYDPTDMYPYKVEEPEESKIAIEDNSPVINPTYIKYNDAPNISKRMEYYIA
ncbi:MAG: hypothetical protein PUC64_02550 [Clostridium sp.]|nr:hypothetical protein [Clostridium sp.]